MDSTWITFPCPEPEGPPEVVPAGTYQAVVLGVTEAVSSREYKYWRWELMPARPFVHAQSRLWFVTSFAPRALWRKKEWIEVLAGTDLECGKPIRVNPENFIGSMVEVDVTINRFNNKPCNSVTEFRRHTR